MSYGREYNTTEELLEKLNDSVSLFVEGMESGFNEITESLSQSLSPVAQQMGDSKTQKSMGSLEKFGKSLKASPQLFILEQLMKLLEPFLALLEPIALIFDVLAGLFSVFTGEILKAMYEGLMPLFDFLIDLMPIFKTLGHLFAILVKVGMIPLQIVLEILSSLLKPFLPLIERLNPIFDALTPILTLFINLGLLPLVASLYGVARAIATVVDFITMILDNIDIFNVTPIRGTNFGAEIDKFFLPIIGDLIGLQEGGLVKKPTIARIAEKEPEVVGPVDKLRGMFASPSIDETHFIDMNDKLDTMISLQQKQTRGLQRRRFG